MPQKLTTTACFIQEESSGGNLHVSIVFFSEYHPVGNSDPRFFPRDMVFARISREIRLLNNLTRHPAKATRAD